MEKTASKMLHVSMVMFLISMTFLVSKAAVEAWGSPEGNALRLAVWGWQPEDPGSPDVDGALDRCLGELAEAAGIPVDLVRLPIGRYYDELPFELQGERPPDVIWVSGGTVSDLATGERLLALDEFLAEMPWVVHDLPGEVLDSFRVERHLFAVPLGPEPELARHGYAVTRNALERGMLGESLELISLLRERVPARGRPDLVLSRFEVRQGPLEENERVSIVAELENIGEEASPGGRVHFLMDDEVIDEAVFRSLLPGETRSYRLEADLPRTGVREFAAMADLEGRIEENNEINNLGWSGGMYQGLGGGVPAAPKALSSPFMIETSAYQVSIQEYWNKYPNVKVGFDGTNYLVVWMQQQKPFKKEFNHRLVGVRISEAGKVLDPAPFSITQSPGHIDTFNLAFDGTNHLVVWQKTLGWKQYQAKKTLPNPYSLIQGARVSKAGKVLDATPIDIESTACPGCDPNWSVPRYEAPDVAFTGTDFLVVYRTGIIGGTQYLDGIDARLVSPSGKVQTGTRILTFPGQVEAVEMQRLAFNPAQNEGFLLFDAHDYAPQPYEIAETGIWIKVNGSKVTGSSLQVITKAPLSGGPVYFCPAIAADGKGNYFGVFEGSCGVEGAAIGPIPSNAAVHTGDVSKGWDSLPDIAFDGKNYTAVYTHVVGCHDVRLSAVRVTPGAVWSSPALYKSGFNSVRDASIAFGNKNGLVVFSNWDDSSPNSADHAAQIVGVLIDRSN